MPSVAGIAKENLDLANSDPNAIYSVTELSRNIKDALAANPQLNNLLLKGEISNFVRAASGHIYFNLKDENCALACAYLRHLQEAGFNDLGNGIQIVATGSVTSYEPRSQYQLNIKKIIPIGDGKSSLKLKRLREKLEAEGLFNQDRKKPVPLLPRKVGIITSKDSAAIKDILTVVNSSCPRMNLVMAYAAMQGEGAPSSIIRALSYLDKTDDVDTIILARGGGTSEDFMAFNDEGLVRAIVSSTKPLITGIGHEMDTCLADLAADFRASTPSTAAKAAVPDIKELGNYLLSNKANLERSYKSYLLSIDAKEKEVRAKQEELQKQRNFLSSLSMNLDRSYDAYLLGLKIRENEVELGKKEVEIMKAMDSGKSDLLKYKALIVVLIAFLVLSILMFLLRGG